MPNMSQMTIGNVTYDLKDTEGRAHVVEVSNTKPVHEDNKIWIKDQENEYVVPSYDEFSDLKAAIDYIADNVFESESTEVSWSQGNIDAGTGASGSSNKRIRSGYIDINENGFDIVIPNGMAARVFYYNKTTHDYLNKYDDWLNGTKEIFGTDVSSIRVLLSYTNGDDITPSAQGLSSFSIIIRTDSKIDDAVEMVESFGEDVKKITSSNRNLWQGESSYTFKTTKDIYFSEPLPAGTYTLSAVVTSDDTSKTKSRALLNGTVTIDIDRDVRSSGTATINEPITYVKLMASQNTSASGRKTATWANIQIEQGTVATEYVAHDVTAKDIIARDAIGKFIKYVSTTGNDSNDGNTPTSAYATIEKALNETAEIIYIEKGTYTENHEYGSDHSNYRYKGLTIIANNATLITNRTLGFRLANKIDIRGLTVQIEDPLNSNVSGIYLYNCNGVLRDCVAIGAPYMGIRLDGSRVTLDRCVAHDNGVDGFNGHDLDSGYSCQCTFNYCTAYNNGDDGLSIHESGKILVIGGEYYGNTQTGIAPHQQCEFEIIGAYCHDNGTSGIESLFPDYETGDIKATGKVISCISTGNGQYGINAGNYNVIVLGTSLTGNTIGTHNAGEGSTISFYTPTNN